MIRRPPRSTLFPTRRSSDLWRRACRPSLDGTITLRMMMSGWTALASGNASVCALTKTVANPSSARARSEEHTSELQSRQYLVCRLLLEKQLHPTTHTPQHDF